MKYNTVIFDLGGVLVDWNPDYVYNTIFENRQEMKWFYENVCTSDWNEEQDAGRSLHEATELLVGRFPDHEKISALTTAAGKKCCVGRFPKQSHCLIH